MQQETLILSTCSELCPRPKIRRATAQMPFQSRWLVDSPRPPTAAMGLRMSAMETCRPKDVRFVRLSWLLSRRTEEKGSGGTSVPTSTCAHEPVDSGDSRPRLSGYDNNEAPSSAATQIRTCSPDSSLAQPVLYIVGECGQRFALLQRSERVDGGGDKALGNVA